MTPNCTVRMDFAAPESVPVISDPDVPPMLPVNPVAAPESRMLKPSRPARFAFDVIVNAVVVRKVTKLPFVTLLVMSAMETLACGVSVGSVSGTVASSSVISTAVVIGAVVTTVPRTMRFGFDGSKPGSMVPGASAYGMPVVYGFISP